MLKRYRSDPSYIVPVEEIEVRPDLTFEEEPIQILYRDIKIFRRKIVPLRDIEYTVGDKVFLKVSLWKKILCFRHKGKLSLRFIWPYEIVKRIRSVAYRLALPSELKKDS
ncbi:Retrotransposon gag protein [Gossypium australe]|uniref:Retrotransposon gag protein n=1 Tax=Gossypium australe TaxID=47621 RepID=A0A5B6WH02_9ROSI|nr:Retrotransposon gag protein [Gossypium australe]